jgi:predicted HTH transcriptional regulator
LTRKARGQMDGVLKLTGRDIQEQELAMRFHSAEGAWEFMGDAEECTRSQQRQEIITLLRRNGPKTPKEIAEATGKNPVNIRSLLWKMVKDQEVKALDGNKYEALKK